METLEQFVDRLVHNVGCYYKSEQNKSGTYSLKKHPSDKPKHMGVFGWVSEKKLTDRFKVLTYKCLADQQGINDADEEKCGAHYVSRGKDKGQGTGLNYFVARGSNSEDFQKTVRALKVIQSNR